MNKRWNLENADRKAVIRISLTAFILFAILIGIIYWAGLALEKSNQTTETRGDLSDRFTEVPSVEYKGELYRPYEKVTTILVIGVDQYSTDTGSGIPYRNGGQADYLLLLVINEDNHTVTPIQIDRDTMAEISILGVLGNDTGTRITQICLSHGFGDGKEQSCQLTQKAVSRLLLGVNIDFFVAMELDGISTLNDTLGGVTVTLEDDFSVLDPTMVKGVTLTLHGKQAEYYVRNRLNIGIGTNEARVVRQKVYMDALGQRISDQMDEYGSADFMSDLMDTLDPYLLTDMKRGRIINEVWNTRDYARLDIVHPKGQYTVGEDGFTEFHADKSALEDLVVETFYYNIKATPRS